MRALLFLVALGSVAHAGRVVMVTERTDLPVALQAAGAVQHLEVVAEPMEIPPGEQVLDRAAAAQHLAITNNASAVVWLDSNEVWVVSADGHGVRHAPLEDASNPRVFAAIALSLLDELAVPPEANVSVDVSVDVPPPPAAPVVTPPQQPVDVTPSAADVVAAVVPARALGQRRSPRLDISLGGFAGERGMSFAQDPPDFPATPPSYPKSGLGGVVLDAAVFPFPESQYGDDLTGWGASVEIQTSVGASLAANDTVNDTYGSYGLNYTAWELGAHYRHKTGRFLFDGMASYGQASWSLESDFPSNVQIPDTSYQYVGAGAKVEVAVGERASVGLGARYLYLLSTGDVSDMDWYGSGSASGLGLDVDCKLPISGAIYLRGLFEYRRIAMSFDGDGNLSTSEGGNSLAVSNITDSWLMVGTQLGMTF
jgi:hypothetical protein